MYILNYNRKMTEEELAALDLEEEPLLIVDHFEGRPLMNIFINQYLLSLGEF